LALSRDYARGSAKTRRVEYGVYLLDVWLISAPSS
jgi:hypothetical protein